MIRHVSSISARTERGALIQNDLVEKAILHEIKEAESRHGESYSSLRAALSTVHDAAKGLISAHYDPNYQRPKVRKLESWQMNGPLPAQPEEAAA